MKSLQSILAVSVLGLAACQPVATPDPTVQYSSDLLRDKGILYVRTEYFDADTGVSLLVGDGRLRSLTTTHEWWVDAENPSRFVHIIAEVLADGPHIREAYGYDGANLWWEINWMAGIRKPQYHDGKDPPVFEDPNSKPDMDYWIGIFAGEGPSIMEAKDFYKARETGRQFTIPFGQVLSLQYRDIYGGDIIARIQANPTHILLEKSELLEGQVTHSIKLAAWEWFDASRFPLEFWLKPPANMPIGP